MSSAHANKDETIKRLEKDISTLQKEAGKNYHRQLLKYWGYMIALLGLFPLAIVIVSLATYFGLLALPEPVEQSILEGISPTVFTAVITINGIIIGFVPLIAFFFIREIRERTDFLEDYWQEEVKKVRKRKEKNDQDKENNSSKTKKLSLINKKYTLSWMLWHNIRSGVLRYTQTYVAVCVLLQMLLVSSFITTMSRGMVSLSLLLDLIFLFIVTTGLLPLISIALYEPSLKFVRYIVGEEILSIEPER